MHRSLTRNDRYRGFTLTEVLVVITIIVLIALAAVPAMRFIMGSRSIESAQNIVGAMVSRARNQAVNDNGTRGVFFFVDPVSDRTTMALVGQSGADDLAQYTGWSANAGLPAYVDPQGNLAFLIPSYYQSGGQFATSSVVALSSRTPNQASYFTDSYETYMKVPRAIVKTYSCVLTHPNPNPGANNYPPNPGGVTYWGPTSLSLELVSDTDFQVLPQGVGLQLINSNPAGIANFDRYVRIGCILFDSKGRFESVPWSVSAGTTIGKAMGIDPAAKALDLSGNGVQPLVSQFGMVLYDRQTYLAQAWPTAGNGNFGEGDWIYSPGFVYPGYTAKNFFLPAYAPKFPPDAPSEQANNAAGSLPSKEQWLDNNSVPLLIDRYNGTLIKGE
jgi:prepilin-type N-terminal cleavage/methylation domain-containing protein